MNKQFTLITLLLLGMLSWSNSLFAQNPALTWAHNGLSFYSLKTDAAGNVYALGGLSGTVDYDPGPGVTNLTGIAGQFAAVAAKYDPSGALLWARMIQLNGSTAPWPKFDVDANGNVYICGNFTETIDLNPTAGTVNKTAVGGEDVFLVKLTTNGAYSWGFSVGTTGFDRYPSVAVDGSGNVFLSSYVPVATIDLDPSAATANATAASDGAFLAKYSSSGTYIWGKRIGVYFAVEMATNAAGDVYLSGDFVGTVDLDPSAAVANLVSAGSSFDVYMAKYTSTGAYVWAKSLACTNTCRSNSFTLDAQENLLVSVQFIGTLDLDPSAGTTNVSTSYSSDRDIAFAKYNSSGSYLWGNSVGPGSVLDDNAFCIRTDAASNVYIAGEFEGTGDFDITSGVYNVSAPGQNAFYAKYTASGSLLWFNHLIGSLAAVNSLAVNADGTQIVVSGSYYTTIDLDYTAGVSNLVTAPSTAAGFLAKYAQNCTSTTSTLTASACSSYTLNAQTYTTSGTYTQLRQNAAGCDSTITLNLTIGDAIAPVASLASLAPVTDQCSVTALTAPTATDNCAGTITGTTTTIFPITAQGTTVVTWTYNDGNGNTSTQTQNVVITDNVAPVAALATLAPITDQCSVTALTAPTANDNCAGTVTGTHNASLPITAQGTTVVTWTYNDGHGNTSTQTQNVVITDNVAPVATLANLANVTGTCSVTTLTAPTANDNCVGTITGTHNASLPITAQGTTVVTWAYNDGHGNTSTQTQNVVITDNVAPVATLANLADVTGSCSVASLTAPTASDNCAGTIAGTHNATLPITAPGTTVVTWTYNDGHGNTATQTQNVIITVPVATTTLSGITISATTAGAAYQWINCAGNTPIAGATAQSFTATANGSYAVIVTQNGCSSTSPCVAITTVGMEELSAEELFSVYPNPNAGSFVVNSGKAITLTILNAAGQVISTQQLPSGATALQLENAESGIYFLSAADENGKVSVRRISIVK